MVIARATDGPKELLFLGLSKKNIERALAGDPVHIRREVHGDGVPEGWEIVIVIGETEASLSEQFSCLIGPETKIQFDQKLKTKPL